MDNGISMKKTLGGSFAAIVTLILSQVLAGAIASIFVLLRIPEGICNIIAGVLYLGLAYLFLKLLVNKLFKMSQSEFGMPRFCVKWKWILVACILPIIVKGSYLLFFNGEYISSNMSGSQVFSTLSAGIFFTGIAAGFVEEMVFRGVILNLLKWKWNIKIAVTIPSLLFGVVHILGMKFSLGSSILVILAGTMVGIMFSIIAIESGSVWNSGIVHAVWNIVIIGGGLSIGEKADEYSVMTYVLHNKSFMITGGEFGIESSMISLLSYIVVAIVTVIMIRIKNKKCRI